jgi:L-Ala-D/L-Glu epimerase
MKQRDATSSEATAPGAHRPRAAARVRSRPATNGAADGPVPIEAIELFTGQIPVHCRFSYGSVDHFRFSVVRVQSGEHTGWGETLVPGGDALLPAFHRLLGADARELDALLTDAAAGVKDVRLEALSIALHDLVARRSGAPLHKLLGRQARTSIPVVPCIFGDSPTESARAANGFVRFGVRHLKAKLVGDADQDLETVKAIRSAVPHDISLRGDANNGYELASVKNGVLGKLKHAGLDVIEDPCEAGPDEYAQLRCPEHPLIMLDVPARSLATLRAFLERGAADIVNLHPCQQGSLTQAIERDALCRAFGVPTFVGGTGYLGIGTAAYHHLATVIGISEPCGELGGHFDHGMPRVWPSTNVEAGNIRPSDLPGIGFEPDLAPLLRFVSDRTVVSRAGPEDVVNTSSLSEARGRK